MQQMWGAGRESFEEVIVATTGKDRKQLPGRI